MDIQSNEQWKLDGVCSVCRRQKYCHTECSPAKKNRKRAIASAIHEALRKKGIPPIIPPYGSEVIEDEKI